jgi:hypothetical protein
MRRKSVSSVFVAAFMILLAFGAIFSLLYLMKITPVSTAPPEPRLQIAYKVSTQYLNITNEGPDTVVIEGLGFFQGPNGYTVPYQASLNSGQTDFIYLYSALKKNITVAVLTNEGAITVKIGR